jgi:hypothetical protein
MSHVRDFNDHTSKYYRELDRLLDEASDHLMGPCENGPQCETMKMYNLQMEKIFTELGPRR